MDRRARHLLVGSQLASAAARHLAVAFLVVTLAPSAPAIGQILGDPVVDVTRFTEESRYEIEGFHSDARLGHSLAMTDDTLVVGAPGYEPTTGPWNSGLLHVYQLIGDQWQLQGRLTASDRAEGDSLGLSVDIDGDVIVATMRFAPRNAVYVFEKPVTGWSDMHETAVLTPSSGQASFGEEVAISGSTIVVGVPLFDNGGTLRTGAAYVYERPPGGWSNGTQSSVLINPNNLFDGRFGTAVDIDGDTLAVGAPRENADTSRTTGTVFVFVRNDSTWTARSYLVPAERTDGLLVGGSVAIEGNVIVGGSGVHGWDRGLEIQGGVEHLLEQSVGPAAYVWVRPGSGWPAGLKTENARLDDSLDTLGYFGLEVAIRDPLIAVGAAPNQMLWYGAGLPAGGQMYLFERPPGGWASAFADPFNPLHPVQVDCRDPFPTPALCDQYFGSAIALSESTLAVGAAAGGVHVDAVYTFVDPTALGADTLFADGFESGGLGAWTVRQP